ncbi:MAG: tetratricopeptide repeat protein [Elusimicrobiales bacterium]
MKKTAFLLTTVFLTSCIATEKDMIILQSQIDDLNSNIYTLKKNQADLMSKIDEVNRTIISFTETSKDLSSEMSNLSSKIDEYNSITDRKINQLGKSIITSTKEDDEASKEAKLFLRAANAYSSGRNKLAIDLLKEYISKYPKSNNIDLAYSYLADILYSEQNFREAAIFYAKIISEFPSFIDIDKIKLRYAICLLNMNDPAKEKEIEQYLKELERSSKDLYIKNLSKNLLNEISKKTKKNIKTN